jgi:glutamate dehydrogenase (NAD(P)+)
VAVQGFGAVGTHSARFLAERGAVLVAASDRRGTIYQPAGLRIAELIALKDSGKTVCDYGDGQKLDRDAVIDVECDIWIPAARPDVVRADNAHRMKNRLVLQGANIPFTEDAERALHERGVLVIPDFIENAGGMICAAMKYQGATGRRPSR